PLNGCGVRRTKPQGYFTIGVAAAPPARRNRRRRAGTIEDKKVDTRRWLIVVRPDRTATQTIRWYLGRQRQEEVVTRYEWSVSYEWQVKDLVWRRVCKQNPPGYECGSEAYRISIKDNELRYTGMSGRGATTMRKVAADYRLP